MHFFPSLEEVWCAVPVCAWFNVGLEQCESILDITGIAWRKLKVYVNQWRHVMEAKGGRAWPPVKPNFRWTVIGLSTTTENSLFAMCLIVCRALYFGHMANKFFAVCNTSSKRQREDTRQTKSLACAQNQTHGKDYVCRVCFVALLFGTHTANHSFVVCFLFGTRQSLISKHIFKRHGVRIDTFTVAFWEEYAD